MTTPAKRAKESADYIIGVVTSEKGKWIAPQVGMVLGSGLGALADSVQDAIRIPYAEIPGFPVSSVVGHAGCLVLGTLNGVNVVIMQGRVHYYEGYSIEEVVRPVRTLGMLGVRNLLLTNAAGGVDLDLAPGTLMIITDHVNLSGVSPLLGPNDSKLGPRFPDMSSVYDSAIVESLNETGKDLGLELGQGVYAWLSGPSYETPAEIRMLRGLGVTAVGMSTVPEAIVARHMGIRVGGVSCITNYGAGIVVDAVLNHKEVEETAGRVRDQFCRLLTDALPRIASLTA